jgi:hypothetical protein
MANQEHLEILHQGVEAWNRWRDERQQWEQREIAWVMEGEILYTKRPFAVDLSGADLEKHDLRQANFQRANLRGVRLVDADLREANLSEADLYDARCSVAILERANLSHTCLSHASFSDANLRQANLRDADLSFANLFHAFLGEADLRETDLAQTNFTWAILHRANLQEAHLSHTLFGDVDLSEVKGLETVKHWRPSIIDIRTLARSSGRLPERFLREAGIDPALIPSLLALFHSYQGFDLFWERDTPPVSPWLTTPRPLGHPHPVTEEEVREWLHEDDTQWLEDWGKEDLGK